MIHVSHTFNARSFCRGDPAPQAPEWERFPSLPVEDHLARGDPAPQRGDPVGRPYKVIHDPNDPMQMIRHNDEFIFVQFNV
jgi:hypothetical protein